MEYIVATEDKKRYWWEILTQINNFKKLNIDKDLIYLIGTKDGKLSKELSHIKIHTGVRIYGIKDTRDKNIAYRPTIRPHIIKKYLYEKHGNGQIKSFLYLDSDVLLLKKIPSTIYKQNNNTWYLSDTKSYLNSNYIKKKGEDLFKEMCRIVDVDPNIIEANDDNAGGAQYLIKNVDWKFWDKVEKDSELLYQHMIKTSNKYNPTHPIQAWTADMWALLWGAIKEGHKVKINKNMDFVWATDNKDKINKNKCFYHNAGVTSQNGLFNKSQHQNRSPFYDDFSFINDNYCSDIYVKEIINTRNKYPELTKFI